MKKVLVIIDGVGDRPCEELGGKTPLEAAKTPNMDFLAENGKTGLVYPVDEKTAPESDVAITAILGYDPYKYFTGRGPLEALGAGLKLKGTKFLALRANFATVDKNKDLVDRRVGRTLKTEEGRVLGEFLKKNLKLPVPFIFKHTTEHRGVLVLKGKFSDQISNIDPAYVRVGTFGVASEKSTGKIPACKALDDNALSKETATIINEFVDKSFELLKDHPINKKRVAHGQHPANIIIVRDAGNKLPKFPKKKGWAAIVGMPLEKGITSLVGMKVLGFEYPKITTADKYQHLTDSLITEIEWSKKHLKDNFKDFDNFYIHFKETDIPGHDGLPIKKKKMIELIDQEFFSFLNKIMGLTIIITADHATPCNMKRHSADPVPLLIYGMGKDDVNSFNEKSCAEGKIGKIYAKDLMKLIKKGEHHE